MTPVRRRVAWLGPLPPETSGIADWSRSLAPALAHHMDLTLVGRDWVAALTPTVDGVPVIGRTEYARRAGEFDVTVHQMGNHHRYHDWVHDELLRRPGITVLHDLVLTDFYRGIGRRLADVADPGAPGAPSLRSCAEVAEASVSLVVHHAAAAQALARGHASTDVVALPLAGFAPSASRSIDVRSALGWSDCEVVIGILGGIDAHKRIELSLRAASVVSRLDRRARLLLVGRAASPTVLGELERAVGELGLAATTAMLVDVDPDELAACTSTCDVVIDLRDDRIGSTSSTVMNALAAGTPVVACELGGYGSARCDGLVLVPTDPIAAVDGAVTAVRALLRRLDRSRAERPLRAAAFEAGAASASSVAGAMAAVVERTLERWTRRPPVPVRAINRAPGPWVTLVGDLTATSGLMEFGRNLAGVMLDAGVRLDHHHVECAGADHDDRRDRRGLRHRLARRREAPIEVWCSNVNEFPVIPDDLLRPEGERRYVIASWFWEVPVLPPTFARQLDRVDEIWVGSPFIARTLGAYTSVPIVVVPAPVAVEVPSGSARDAYGITDDDVVFFFDFDANSTEARKNPFALVDAFERAFPGSSSRPADAGRPRLVLKVGNAGRAVHRSLVDHLRTRLDLCGGVLIDAELTRLEMNGLLAGADVYVSMHRAEGLGMGMLEAMYVGVPVVAPAYPERWLFPGAAVGSLIAAPMRPVRSSDHGYAPGGTAVYPPGLIWTEPSVEQMAGWMRLLHERPDLRRDLGERQADLVRQHYQPAATARVVLERLQRAACSGVGHRVLTR